MPGTPSSRITSPPSFLIADMFCSRVSWPRANAEGLVTKAEMNAPTKQRATEPRQLTLMPHLPKILRGLLMARLP